MQSVGGGPIPTDNKSSLAMLNGLAVETADLMLQCMSGLKQMNIQKSHSRKDFLHDIVQEMVRGCLRQNWKHN